MDRKTTVLVFLFIFILQSIGFAMGGKSYHRAALNKINAKLEYLEKNMRK